MCNITFEVSRSSTFVFKKSSEKISTIIFVVKSLKGLGWNNVGPASQTVAKHYFTIGPMYRVIRIVAFRGIKRHPYGSQSKHGTITQLCFNGGPASNTIDRHSTSNGLRVWLNITILCILPRPLLFEHSHSSDPLSFASGSD